MNSTKEIRNFIKSFHIQFAPSTLPRQTSCVFFDFAFKVNILYSNILDITGKFFYNFHAPIYSIYLELSKFINVAIKEEISFFSNSMYKTFSNYGIMLTNGAAD